MKFDTAIFDLDGTLLNTLPDLHASVNYALSDAGMPPRTIDEVRRFVGNGVVNLIRRAVPEETAEADIQSVFACFKAYYGEHSCDMTKPYAGIPALICALRERGIKCAVVSNKAQFATSAICERYFPDMFDIVYGERESEGIPKKPAPDAVFAAMRETSAVNAVYIGDSEVDVATAKNAGLPCIAVTWGFREKYELEGADHFADTADEVYNLIIGGADAHSVN